MRREAWLGLSIMGAISVLPLGWAAFILLLFVPGFALASLFKEKFTLAEAVAIPLTLSLILIPLSALVTAPLPYHPAPFALCLMVIAIGSYNYWKNRDLAVDVAGAAALAAGALIFIVVLGVSLRTFHFQDGELFYTFTQGLDQTFHLSIAQRYIVMPAIPPQDPYFAGAAVPYDWFMHVMLGEVCRNTGLQLFDVFKAVVAVASALIFLDAYLLAGLIFQKDKGTALAASLLYVLSSGLSWAYILATQQSSPDVTMFLSLVYQWQGITSLKYDPTSLYFFLPQPQTFGILVAVFCLYLFTMAIRSRSVAIATVTGVAMASLVFYHLITAFPVLVTILGMSLYLALKEMNRPALTRLAIPLALGGAAVLVQYLILPDNAGSQLAIGHHRDVLVTFLATLGPLAPFAIYGMYKGRDDDGTKLLAIFTFVNAAALNVFVLDMTNNTYRFLTYLSLPMALFAGKVLYGWLSSKDTRKKATAAAIALIMIPSTFLVAYFYISAPAVSLASPMDVKAIGWIKDNTPVNAIVYENPDHFPRVPILSGRNVAFAGKTYVKQYHGADLFDTMNGIMAIGDPQDLHETMAQFNVNYVLYGGKEQSAWMGSALADTRYFKIVYTDGSFSVFEVVGVPIKG